MKKLFELMIHKIWWIIATILFLTTGVVVQFLSKSDENWPLITVVIILICFCLYQVIPKQIKAIGKLLSRVIAYLEE